LEYSGANDCPFIDIRRRVHFRRLKINPDYQNLKVQSAPSLLVQAFILFFGQFFFSPHNGLLSLESTTGFVAALAESAQDFLQAGHYHNRANDDPKKVLLDHVKRPQQDDYPDDQIKQPIHFVAEAAAFFAVGTLIFSGRFHWRIPFLSLVCVAGATFKIQRFDIIPFRQACKSSSSRWTVRKGSVS
jgi:hypothetical protein